MGKENQEQEISQRKVENPQATELKDQQEKTSGLWKKEEDALFKGIQYVSWA